MLKCRKIKLFKEHSHRLLKGRTFLIGFLFYGLVYQNAFADDNGILFNVATGIVKNICGSIEYSNFDIAYQVGAFLKIENARLFAKNLLLKGFYGEIRKKKVNESVLWVVTVAKEQNPFLDRQAELFKAGFPSFPVRVFY